VTPLKLNRSVRGLSHVARKLAVYARWDHSIKLPLVRELEARLEADVESKDVDA
jgi:hypothetical protein